MSEALASGPVATADVRPVVPLSGSGNLGLWVFLAALALGGIALFTMLSERRAAVTAPRTAAIAESGEGRIASPPPLALPGNAEYGYPVDRHPVLLRRIPRDGIAPASTLARAARPGSLHEAATPAQQPTYYPPAPLRDIARAGSFEPRPPLAEPPGSGAAVVNESGRVRASRLASPTLTVPQGTVIPAVLETALDSTRPGATRALVQRDVYGFDGSRVLIPRGSRLYGEYEADLGSGQKRAAVRWSRLLRPDGVTIALDSPASDPLGRAGVKGKVDSKFLQRFGGALLQSVLDVGVGLAASRATDGVIVALPGSTQNVRVSDGNEIKPTLSVRQGTSVSVFVARDLDFTGVDG